MCSRKGKYNINYISVEKNVSNHQPTYRTISEYISILTRPGAEYIFMSTSTSTLMIDENKCEYEYIDD